MTIYIYAHIYIFLVKEKQKQQKKQYQSCWVMGSIVARISLRRNTLIFYPSCRNYKKREDIFILGFNNIH